MDGTVLVRLVDSVTALPAGSREVDLFVRKHG